MSSWLGSILFVVGIAAAIALHEWGHFVTARRFGMRAERYFLGFGPTVWSTRRGETEYGVKAFLLGGFVKIAGMSTGDTRQPPAAATAFDPEAVAADRRATAEEQGIALDDVPAIPERTWIRLREELARRGVPERDREALVAEAVARAGRDDSPREAMDVFERVVAERLPETGRVNDLRHRVLQGDRGRFFHDRPAWERAVVLSAGSGMHFLQAIVLLFVAFLLFGMQAMPVIDDVLPGTPAAHAGMRPGDRIVAVAGQEADDFAAARRIIERHAGEPVRITVERGGERHDITLTAALAVEPTGAPALLEAGFEPGDRILTVAGEDVGGVGDLREMAARGGEVPVTVQRFVPDPETAAPRSERVELSLAAEHLDELADHVTGLAGFRPELGRMGPLDALEATFVGDASFPALFVGSVKAFGLLFSPEGLGSIPAQISGGERDATGGASLVGLTQIAGQGTATAGLFFLLGLLASLNVFVGIFNLVPLPPLDGGHLGVLAVERSVNAVRELRGREPDYRVDPSTITAIAVPVLVLLGVMFLSFVLLDITNPLRLPTQ